MTELASCLPIDLTGPTYPEGTKWPVPNTLREVRDDLSPQERMAAISGVALRLELANKDFAIALDAAEHDADLANSRLIGKDVQLAQAYESLDSAAYDKKTGLLTYAAFEERVTTVLQDRRTRPEGTDNYLFFIDLDDFKVWNKLFTETLNDHETLIPAANILRKSVRNNIDYAGRWGGEEFILFVQNMKPSDVASLGYAVRDKINRMPTREQPTGIDKLGVSMGYAMLNSAEDYSTSLELANLGLKYVKHMIAGKNQIKNANDLSANDIAHLNTLE